jgi:hypothetical protein
MAILWQHYDRNGRDSEIFTNGKPSRFNMARFT